MRGNLWMMLAAVAGSAVALHAEDAVKVIGTEVSYPTRIQSRVGDQVVTMVLTGTAIRKKLFVHVYTIGSYLAKDAKVDGPGELAAADAAKQLHLVLEREVPGKDIAENLRRGIEGNYPKQFDAELKILSAHIVQDTWKKGESVRFTHIPGKGLECHITGKTPFRIDSPRFSQAFWEIYLGKVNLGDRIRDGLVSRLR